MCVSDSSFRKLPRGNYEFTYDDAFCADGSTRKIEVCFW